MDEIQKVLVQSGRKDLAQKYYEKVAGRSVTPTYVVKYKDNDRKNRSDRTIEWKKEYGKPNLANLKKWREKMNKSFEKGGANYHISKSVGFIVRISDAEIVNQKTGDTVVKFKAPMFEAARTNPDDWKKNFITTGNVMLAVEVIAAENDGWRTQVGITQGGKTIERDTIKSEWSKTFEDAEKKAKSMARKFKIKYAPKHYGNR